MSREAPRVLLLVFIFASHAGGAPAPRYAEGGSAPTLADESKWKGFFDKTLSYYDTSKFVNAAMTKAALEKILLGAGVKIKHVVRALDVGCGTGQTLRFFAEHCATSGCKLEGIDYSDRRVAAAQNASADTVCTGVCNFRVANVYNVSSVFNLKSFDLIVCTEVLEHLVDPSAVVQQMRMLLAPGGVLIISTYVQLRLFGPNHNHLHAFHSEAAAIKKLGNNWLSPVPGFSMTGHGPDRNLLRFPQGQIVLFGRA